MALENSIKPTERWCYDAQSHKYGQFEKRLHIIIGGQMQIHRTICTMYGGKKAKIKR